MTLIRKCDRCKREMHRFVYTELNRKDKSKYTEIRHDYDICNECLQDFVKFMHQEEVSKDE